MSRIAHFQHDILLSTQKHSTGVIETVSLRIRRTQPSRLSDRPNAHETGAMLKESAPVCEPGKRPHEPSSVNVYCYINFIADSGALFTF
jgi:hypothetical protein